MERQLLLPVTRLLQRQFAAYYHARASDRCRWVLDALVSPLNPDSVLEKRCYGGWHLELVWIDGALCVADFRIACGGASYGEWTAQPLTPAMHAEVRRHALTTLAQLRRALRAQGYSVAQWPALPKAA